jgi:hypothetical protein
MDVNGDEAGDESVAFGLKKGLLGAPSEDGAENMLGACDVLSGTWDGVGKPVDIGGSDFPNALGGAVGGAL